MEKTKNILNDYYKKEGKKVSDRTIKSYLSRIKLVYNGLDMELGDVSLFSERLQEAINYIQNRWKNTSTRKTAYAALVILAKAMGLDNNIVKFIQDIMTDSISTYNTEQKVKIGGGEKLPNVNFSKIKKILLKKMLDIDLNKKFLEKENMKTLTQVLIFYLYSIQAPVRSDYGAMRILHEGETEDKKYNYVDLKKKVFIFNSYKTEKKYGRVEISFRKGMDEKLKQLMPFVSNKDYLFTGNNGKGYTQNYFSILINEVFGVGVSTLRKVYLTNKYKKIYSILNEMDKDAQDMLHSPAIVRSHYLFNVIGNEDKQKFKKIKIVSKKEEKKEEGEPLFKSLLSDEPKEGLDIKIEENKIEVNDKPIIEEKVLKKKKKQKFKKIKMTNKNIISDVPINVLEQKTEKKKTSKKKTGGEATAPTLSQLPLSSDGGLEEEKKEKEEEKEEEKNYYQIDIYKFYKQGIEGEEGIFNEMKENYNHLSDRADELFFQYNKTTDEEKKEMIFENYDDYNKSKKRLLKNILIKFPYYFK